MSSIPCPPRRPLFATHFHPASRGIAYDVPWFYVEEDQVRPTKANPLVAAHQAVGPWYVIRGNFLWTGMAHPQGSDLVHFEIAPNRLDLYPVRQHPHAHRARKPYYTFDKFAADRAAMRMGFRAGHQQGLWDI